VKKILAVLTIASALLLTGCSQNNEAATIGDFKISQTELQSSIDAVMAERTKVDTSQMQLETGEEFNRGQLRFKILMHTFDEIAKELKIDVTSISDQVAAALSQSGVPDEEVSTKVGDLLNAKAKTLGVKINPRYGVWDNEIGDVVAANVTGDAVKPSDK